MGIQLKENMRLRPYFCRMGLVRVMDDIDSEGLDNLMIEVKREHPHRNLGKRNMQCFMRHSEQPPKQATRETPFTSYTGQRQLPQQRLLLSHTEQNT